MFTEQTSERGEVGSEKRGAEAALKGTPRRDQSSEAPSAHANGRRLAWQSCELSTLPPFAAPTCRRLVIQRGRARAAAPARLHRLDSPAPSDRRHCDPTECRGPWVRQA